MSYTSRAKVVPSGNDVEASVNICSGESSSREENEGGISSVSFQEPEIDTAPSRLKKRRGTGIVLIDRGICIENGTEKDISEILTSENTQREECEEKYSYDDSDQDDDDDGTSYLSEIPSNVVSPKSPYFGMLRCDVQVVEGVTENIEDIEEAEQDSVVVIGGKPEAPSLQPDSLASFRNRTALLKETDTVNVGELESLGERERGDIESTPSPPKLKNMRSSTRLSFADENGEILAKVTECDQTHYEFQPRNLKREIAVRVFTGALLIGLIVPLVHFMS